MAELTVHDAARTVLIFSHLLLCAVALTRVLQADLELVAGSITRERLASVAHTVSWLLGGLWLTGLAVIYLDTGFDPQVLAGKSKLLLKLTCVMVLTTNGALLHHVAFPLLSASGPLRLNESLVLTVTGALSSSHWIMAAFVGIARPLGKIELTTLLQAYALMCTVTVLAALALVPVVRERLTDLRMRWEIESMRYRTRVTA